MKIIPAIDIIGGKCVRLTKGDFSQMKEYASDPVEVAKTFDQAGIKRLHVVDLDGARAGKTVNLPVLERICQETDLFVDFGGGVKTHNDLKKVFAAGAKQVTAGSVAVKEPELVRSWLEDFGSEKIIVGADVLNEKIMISGWQETSGLSIWDFLGDFLEAGAEYVICTDIAKDGLLQGPATRLYKRLIKDFPEIKLIASGGVSSKRDLLELAGVKPFGTIVGKAFYEGKVSLQDLIELDDAN